MRFLLMVTGPPYGTQQASSALLFAEAVLAAGHKLISVFFYGEGVYNANHFITPASDEYDLVRSWKSLHENYGIELNICIAAALRRGITINNNNNAQSLKLSVTTNMEPGFSLSGLGTLAEYALTYDRIVQF